MPPAELFNFPRRRDGDMPPDAVALLRRLAKDAAEAGADPQAVVAADLNLLLLCDAIVAFMRHIEDAEDAWRRASHRKHPGGSAYEYDEVRSRRRALAPALIRAMKCRAVTPAGLFAKACAIKRVGRGAAGLAVSLAADLLAAPELRAAIWPAGEQK